MTELCTFQVEGRQIAYRRHIGSGPTIIFLSGYGSDMDGTKALALEDFAKRRGKSSLRFDYSGTGSSSGRFEEATLADWLEEALAVIDCLSEGPVILVGSSMGAWIALHLALLRPQRVKALLGIASAPDFTDWGFTPEQKERLKSDGRLEEPNPFGAQPRLVTREFWESGQRMLLLDGQLAIDCPVRLIHGDRDDEVPFEIALRTLRALRSADVQLLALKGGGHRLSEPREIEAILWTVGALVEPAR